MYGIIALLGALGSFFFFGFLFSEPSPPLPLGFLFAGGFELLASFLDDFWRTKSKKQEIAKLFEFALQSCNRKYEI
jgi:UDP-N-acetylmuramyl pentapeptide phosphotransferase/UDP-N-acetylglucosamine-1-phosphate transferase